MQEKDKEKIRGKNGIEIREAESCRSSEMLRPSVEKLISFVKLKNVRAGRPRARELRPSSDQSSGGIPDF